MQSTLLVGGALQIHISDVGFNPKSVPREEFLSLKVTFEASEIDSFYFDPSKLRVTTTDGRSMPVSVFRIAIAAGGTDTWILTSTQLSNVIQLSPGERFFEFRILGYPTTETFDMHIEGIYFRGARYDVPRITFRRESQRGSFV